MNQRNQRIFFMKRTVLDQIEITSENAVQIRLAKQVVYEGEVIASQWHRMAFMPHQNIESGMAAVSQDLASRVPAYPAVRAKDIEKIKAFAALAWEGVEPWVAKE
jgi:hypothetical protein